MLNTKHHTDNNLQALHTRFEPILLALETHGAIFFRYLKCPHRKADAIQEMRSLGWKWFVRLIQMGKDPEQFLVTFCRLLGRAVKSGRRVCGQEWAKEALSPLTQQRHRYVVQTLPQYDTFSDDNPILDALRDNEFTPPDEQAAFRIDFAQWLYQLGQRNRQIAEDMMLNEHTQDLAVKHKITPGRVSQLRREFHLDWHRFHGEASI